MNEKTTEWNLGFALEEVIAGLERMLSAHGYRYTGADADTEPRFQVMLAAGSLALHAHPLPAQRSPFGPHIGFHRTLLKMTFAGVEAEEESRFMRKLTLAFLRVGG